MRACLLLVLCALLPACVQHYQYEAHGTLVRGDATIPAVLYWREQARAGGMAQRRQPVDAVLRSCREVPRSFAPDADGKLVMPGSGADYRVGVLQADDAAPVCAQVLLEGVPAGTAALLPGLYPVLVFDCHNVERPQRWPDVGQYRFGPVMRAQVAPDVPAPDPCRDGLSRSVP